jgi:hypothetical protein
MWRSLFSQAEKVFDQLTSEYERVYYNGVAWERLAKAQLDDHQAHNAAHAFEHALGLYERAQKLAPEAADPVLRWNRCVRALKEHPDIARAMEAPRTSGFGIGDYE